MRECSSFTQKTAKTAKKAAEGTKKSAQFLAKNWKVALIVLAILLIVAFLLSVVSSCSVMVQSGASALGGSSYAVEDTSMQDAEAQYCALEGRAKFNRKNTLTEIDARFKSKDIIV